MGYALGIDLGPTFSAAAVARNGQADDIAHAIRFLIENRFTTGETLDINGGLFMR